MRVLNSQFLQQPIFYKRGMLKRSQLQINSNRKDLLWLGLWRTIWFSRHGLILRQSDMMERLWEIFWSWEAQEVEKRHLFKKYVKILRLENTRKSTGFQKSSSPSNGKLK